MKGTGKGPCFCFEGLGYGPGGVSSEAGLRDNDGRTNVLKFCYDLRIFFKFH